MFHVKHFHTLCNDISRPSRTGEERTGGLARAASGRSGHLQTPYDPEEVFHVKHFPTPSSRIGFAERAAEPFDPGGPSACPSRDTGLGSWERSLSPLKSTLPEKQYCRKDSVSRETFPWPRCGFGLGKRETASLRPGEGDRFPGPCAPHPGRLIILSGAPRPIRSRRAKK
jgi:hypothetical protein